MDIQPPSTAPKSIAPAITKLAKAMMVLSVIALFITAYLIYAHFKPEATSFCNISESLNCEVVNQSVYSELFGIPVAILGFLTYLVLFVITLKLRKPPQLGQRGKFSHLQMLQAAMVISGVGVAFSLYLTYIEAFVLMTWCIFCVAQQLIVLAIFILSLIALSTIKQDVKERSVCEFC